MTKPKQAWVCQRCGGRGVISPRATPRSKICAWCANELVRAGQKWCTTGRHASADWAPDSKMCRACQKAHNQAYHAAHREEMLAYNRDWHAAHRDEMIARSRTYYQEHRQQLLDQKRVYYLARRELIKAKVRAHRQHIPQASREKARARHHAKHQIYKHNEKLARARRFVLALRGAR